MHSCWSGTLYYVFVSGKVLFFTTPNKFLEIYCMYEDE